MYKGRTLGMSYGHDFQDPYMYDILGCHQGFSQASCGWPLLEEIQGTFIYSVIYCTLLGKHAPWTASF